MGFSGFQVLRAEGRSPANMLRLVSQLTLHRHTPPCDLICGFSRSWLLDFSVGAQFKSGALCRLLLNAGYSHPCL